MSRSSALSLLLALSLVPACADDQTSGDESSSTDAGDGDSTETSSEGTETGESESGDGDSTGDGDSSGDGDTSGDGDGGGDGDGDADANQAPSAPVVSIQEQTRCHALEFSQGGGGLIDLVAALNLVSSSLSTTNDLNLGSHSGTTTSTASTYDTTVTLEDSVFVAGNFYNGERDGGALGSINSLRT